MSFHEGHRIGPYQILALIGAGGMGEVYRARDTKLNRDVAIKLLLPSVANDPDRLARFGREAQVLASLNHPNIAAIYGLEEGHDESGPHAQALVIELVEGPTLADLITAASARGASRGLAVADALPIARQIAEALEAAHEQGIIHRDLKPANIKVREDGTVKVLDFGLAKALSPDASKAASGSVSMSPTLSVHGTQVGMILGTAAYMSPEQAAGKPADKRSDLWAFGVVLFEMLTGRRAFEGEDVSYVLAAVLKDTPDWNALPATTPAPIRKLLRHCLEKNRKQRLDSATAARLEIEDALAPSAAETSRPVSVPQPPPSAWTKGAPLLAGVALGVALAAAAAAGLMFNRPSPPTTTALRYTPFSFEPGGNSDAVWSPDGKGVAFAARQRDDAPPQVYVRYLGSSTSTQLTHLSEAAFPIAWTPAGRIIFRTSAAPAGLWSISQTGGEAEPLLANVGTSVGGVGTSAGVSPDGGAIADYARGDDKRFGVWISSPAGSPPTRYEPAPFEDESGVNVPRVRFSPDGTQLLLVRNTGRGEEAWLMPYPPDPNHPPRRIFETMLASAGQGTPSFSWMPDNRRVILAIGSSLGNRLFVADTVSGESSPFSSGTTSQSQPAVSPDGTRLVFTESATDYNVIQVNLGSGRVSPILATRRDEDMPAWAMHAAVMAYVTDRTGEPEIWLHEPGRPDRPIVTPRDFVEGTTAGFMTPVPSPDGSRIIYFRVVADGASTMWLSAASGGAPVRVLTQDSRESLRQRPGAWSPNGASFVYWDSASGSTSVNLVRTTGQARPEVLVPRVAAPGNAVPVWSPTGEWILHNSDGWRLSSPDGKTERDLGLRALVCAFSRDGAELYCVRAAGLGGTLFSRPVAGGPERVIAELEPSQMPATRLNPSVRMTLTPDGEHLTFSARTQESNLWLVEGIPQ